MRALQRVVGASAAMLWLALSPGSTPIDAQTGGGAAGGQRITIFDRRGAVVAVLGEPASYGQPALSPDATRVAVAKVDPQTLTTDIWVIDVSTGSSRRITSDPAVDTEPVWSPDGSDLAFISRRAGVWAIYRTSATGARTEALLYRHQGFGAISNLGWSADGRVLTFSDFINISGAMYVLPLDGDANAREVLRPPLFNARIAPDGRWISYPSNQAGTLEIHVRPFDLSPAATPSESTGSQRVSTDGAVGMALWRQDGREMYYLAPGRGVMVVDVMPGSPFRSGQPRLLFQAPSTRAAARLVSVSGDGERFIFAVPPPPPVQQLTMFDDAGMFVRAAGKPGVYAQASLSPSGARIAAIHTDVETGNQDIWTVDVTSGATSSLTSDSAPDSAPVWSPDGKEIAFVSTRVDYTGIYKRAWNGAGREELLYQHTPGTPSVVLTDWSADGRFLSFYAGDTLYALALDGRRTAIEIERTEYSTIGGRFSPDGRFIAYLSDQSGRYEVYVRRFGRVAAAVPAGPWQISATGAQGLILWRPDGRELRYLAADGRLMAVSVRTTPTFQAGATSVLFSPPSVGTAGPYAATGNAVQLRNFSHDGRRFVFALPAQ